MTEKKPIDPYFLTAGGCFGWYADCMSINPNVRCGCQKQCFEDWKKSGGRMGGLFDKYKKIQKEANE